MIESCQASNSPGLLSFLADGSVVRAPIANRDGAVSTRSTTISIFSVRPPQPLAAISRRFWLQSLLVFLIVMASFGFSQTGYAQTLSGLTLLQPVIHGGDSTFVTVKLSAGAPVGDAIVAFSCANKSASVPPNVRIPFGATSATMILTTTPVTSDSSPTTIIASYQNDSFKATLALLHK